MKTTNIHDFELISIWKCKKCQQVVDDPTEHICDDKDDVDKIIS